MRHMRLGDRLNDNKMNIYMLQFVLENGESIASETYGDLSVLDFAHSKRKRFAVRLVQVVLAQIPTETKRWTPENVDEICQSLRISQYHKAGLRCGLFRLQPGLIQSVFEHFTEYPDEYGKCFHIKHQEAA